MSYTRVIPRDLFNESKLLKCLGRFELMLMDGERDNAGKRLPPIRTEHDGKSFNIEQEPGDGSISCTNYRAFLDGRELKLFIPLNSREAWPLYAYYKDQEYCIFDNKGEWMPNFGWRSSDE